MGSACFGSKATAGLCQAPIGLMPPRSAHIETHLGGGAITKRKSARRYRHDYSGRLTLDHHRLQSTP